MNGNPRNNRNYENNITINSDKSLDVQMSSMKHETHHVLTKVIAKACGKGSVEYKIWLDGINANNEIHAFEEKSPKIVKKWKECQKLLKTDVNKAKQYLKANKSDVDSIFEYDQLFNNYWNSELEKSARDASKGVWKFFGKDIKQYDRILRENKGRNSTLDGNGKSSIPSKMDGSKSRPGEIGSVRGQRDGKLPNDGSVAGNDASRNVRPSIKYTESKDWERFKAEKARLAELKKNLSNMPMKQREV